MTSDVSNLATALAGFTARTSELIACPPHPEWVPLRVAPGVAADRSTSGGTAHPRHHRPRDPGSATLSSRERQVLELVAEGLTDAQVASRLGLRTATVSRHLHRVYLRHEVANRVAAVGLLAVQSRSARRQTVVTPPE